MGNKIDGACLPPNFQEVLGASLRRSTAKILRDQAGLNRSEATKYLSAISKKFIKNADGTLAISPSHTRKEIDLIKCLTSFITARAAFSEDRLFNDFVATLKSRALLKNSELEAFQKLKPGISLFAVSVMHRCTIQIGGGAVSQLYATANGPKGAIEVIASVPVLNPMKGGTLQIASGIFSTGLDGPTHCHPDLLKISEPWDFEIEVDSAMQLTRLG